MTILQKITEINKACDNTLSFTRYGEDWEIHSYRDNSPLDSEKVSPHLSGKTFKECVDKAYKFIFEK